jgi:hypothetical protein
MKIIYSIFISLVIVIANENLIAQCNSQTLLAKLNSDDRVEIYEALDSIIICNITEAIPTLESKFNLEQGITLKHYLLDALYKLNANNVESLANSFINSVDDLHAPEGIKLSNKLSAIKILFELDDYSKAQLVFDIADNNTLSLNSLLIDLLEIIAQNVPAMEEGAKSRLISQSLNARYGWDRFRALNILVNNYDSEMTDLVLGISENDPDMSVRMQALEHLISLNYSSLKQFLNQRIHIEEDPSIRVNIADAILTVFGEPSDLKSVMDYLPNEIDSIAYSVIGNYIDLFIPPKPASLNWSGMITKLISYTTEMYSYQCIANTQTRDYYISKLNLLKRQIESRRYKDACKTINNDLLARIETDLTANNITNEGYKFLHYYCVYIKEDFSQTYTPCP